MSGARPRRGWLLALAVLLGLASCMAAGGGVALLGLGASLAVVGGLFRGRPLGPHGLRWWRTASGIVVSACGLGLLLGLPVFVVVFGMLCWLQVHRVWASTTAADDRIALLQRTAVLLCYDDRCVFSDAHNVLNNVLVANDVSDEELQQELQQELQP